MFNIIIVFNILYKREKWMCFIEQSFYFNFGPLFLKKILRKGKINKYFGSYAHCPNFYDKWAICDIHFHSS